MREMEMSQIELLIGFHVLQIAIVALLVWIITKWLTRKHAHLSHVLWLVVLVKCFTPPFWSSPIGIFSWISWDGGRASMTRSIEPRSVTVPMSRTEAIESSRVEGPLSCLIPAASGYPNEIGLDATVSKGASIRIRSALDSQETKAEGNTKPLYFRWLVVGWLSMTAMSVCWTCLWAASWRRRLKVTASASAELQAVTDQLASRLKLRRTVRLLVTSSSVGPAVVGLFRPMIVVPQFIVQRSSLDELKPIIAHELIHVRRGDLWFALLRHLARCLWWFHPLVWKASSAVRRSAECCCDEEVIASLDISAKDYARALMRVLEFKHVLKTVPVAPGVRPFDITFQRLERIMKLRQGSRQRTPRWCWAAGLLLAAVSLPGAALIHGDDAAPDESQAPSETDAISRTETTGDFISPPAPVPTEANDESNDLDASTVEIPSVQLECMVLTSSSQSFSGLQVPWRTITPRPKNSQPLDARPAAPGSDAPHWAESQVVVEKRLPILYALLSDDEAKAVKIKSAETKLVSWPKLRVPDGRSGEIQVGNRRVFVMGIDEQSQPESQELQTGIMAEFVSTITDSGVQLSYTLTQTKIRSVATIDVDTGMDSTIALQVPEVERSTIRGMSQVPDGKTLLVRIQSDSARTDGELILAMVKPTKLQPVRKATVDKNASLTRPMSTKVLDDDSLRHIRQLSLDDCIRIAIENVSHRRTLGIRVCESTETEGASKHPPIRLAPSNSDVRPADAEMNARNFLYEITKAYWQLYASWKKVDACRAGMAQAQTAWKPRRDEGSSDEAARAQYASFQSRLEAAKTSLQQQESRLRYLLGVASDGQIIRPVDEPTKAKVVFDWEAIKGAAAAHAPEILRQRNRVRQQELQIVAAKKQLLPRVDHASLNRFLGLEKKPVSERGKVETLVEEDQEWAIGYQMQSPLGVRAELAQLRDLQLQHARASKQLEDVELETIHELGASVRRTDDRYRCLLHQFNALKACRDQSIAASEGHERGVVSLDVVLDADLRLGQSEIDYHQTLSEYQLGIAEVHYRKGTLLETLGCEIEATN